MAGRRKLEFHPIAAIFPLLDGPEYGALCADVAEHGVREPITVYQGRILDGRNRYRAAVDEGKPFETWEFEGGPLDAIALVWSENRVRRQLNPSQAAICEDEREEKIADYAAQIEKEREKARERQAATGKHARRDKKGRLRPVTQEIGEPDRNERTTDAKRAKAVGTNRTYLAAARAIRRDHPDKAEHAKIAAGFARVVTTDAGVGEIHGSAIARGVEASRTWCALLATTPPTRPARPAAGPGPHRRAAGEILDELVELHADRRARPPGLPGPASTRRSMLPGVLHRPGRRYRQPARVRTDPGVLTGFGQVSFPGTYTERAKELFFADLGAVSTRRDAMRCNGTSGAMGAAVESSPRRPHLLAPRQSCCRALCPRTFTYLFLEQRIMCTQVTSSQLEKAQELEGTLTRVTALLKEMHQDHLRQVEAVERLAAAYAGLPAAEQRVDWEDHEFDKEVQAVERLAAAYAGLPAAQQRVDWEDDEIDKEIEAVERLAAAYAGLPAAEQRVDWEDHEFHKEVEAVERLAAAYDRLPAPEERRTDLADEQE